MQITGCIHPEIPIKEIMRSCFTIAQRGISHHTILLKFTGGTPTQAGKLTCHYNYLTDFVNRS